MKCWYCGIPERYREKEMDEEMEGDEKRGEINYLFAFALRHSLKIKTQMKISRTKLKKHSYYLQATTTKQTSIIQSQIQLTTSIIQPNSYYMKRTAVYFKSSSNIFNEIDNEYLVICIEIETGRR